MPSGGTETEEAGTASAAGSRGHTNGIIFVTYNMQTDCTLKMQIYYAFSRENHEQYNTDK